MRKITLLIICLFNFQLVWSQKIEHKIEKDFESGWGTLNYAVPESPAFKILDISPSSIMRPTSTRDIAFSIGNSLITNGLTIPQNLTVELSPTLLKPHLNLKDFQKNSFLYTSALSIGTKVNKDKSYGIALGLKFRIFDQQDLRLNKELLTRNDLLGRIINDSYSRAMKEMAQDRALKNPQKKPIDHLIDISRSYSDGSAPDHKQVYDGIASIMKRTIDPGEVERFRDSIKKSNWNKPQMYMGIASLFNSKDSLLSNLSGASKLGLWSTAGFPVGKKGQILIGLNGQMADTLGKSLNNKKLDIGTRLYYGENNLKGFIEGNVQYRNIQKPCYKASIGIETTFFGGLWANFSLGFKKENGAKAVFSPGFNLYFANGEKKIGGL